MSQHQLIPRLKPDRKEETEFRAPRPKAVSFSSREVTRFQHIYAPPELSTYSQCVSLPLPLITTATIIGAHTSNIQGCLNYGNTILMLAADENHTGIVNLLIEAGADVNMQDDHGSTALMKAASHGHNDIVRILLKAGAEVNLRDDHDQTALRRATSFLQKQLSTITEHNRNTYTKYVNIVDLLIEAGAEE